MDVDITWPGAPLARMLRVHGQDRFKKQGQTVLQMAAVVAHRGTNPIQIHYASLLLQVGVLDLYPSQTWGCDDYSVFSTFIISVGMIGSGV